MKRLFQKYAVIALLLVLALVFAVQQAQAAEFWKQKFTRFSATAGETLATGDVACIASDDSRTYKADADVATLRNAVGVIGQGGAAGETVEIVVSGILAGQTAASAGSKLYLSATPGAITTTANEWGQIVGIVMEGTATEVAASQSTTYFISVLPVQASGQRLYN